MSDLPAAPEAPEPVPVAAASPLDEHPSPVAPRRLSGRALGSVAIGLLGIVLSFVPILAWLLGALAISFGFQARRSWRGARRSVVLATIGIVIGFLALAAGVLMVSINASG